MVRPIRRKHQCPECADKPRACRHCRRAYEREYRKRCGAVPGVEPEVTVVDLSDVPETERVASGFWTAAIRRLALMPYGKALRLEWGEARVFFRCQNIIQSGKIAGVKIGWRCIGNRAWIWRVPERRGREAA